MYALKRENIGNSVTEFLLDYERRGWLSVRWAVFDIVVIAAILLIKVNS